MLFNEFFEENSESRINAKDIKLALGLVGKDFEGRKIGQYLSNLLNEEIETEYENGRTYILGFSRKKRVVKQPLRHKHLPQEVSTVE
jgi:hypothetical protein